MQVRQVIPRDAIPSVDDPTFGLTYDGPDDDRVLVYEPADGPARAYPLRYLNYHEIVNDDADRPIAVTWCPLCGSAVVYDRRLDAAESVPTGAAVPDGPLTFGVSGKLADDDLVMYDRETDSEWKQSLGESIAGTLEGALLAVLPAAVVEYGTFERDHDDGLVLQPPGGESEAAGPGDDPAPVEYDSDPYRGYAQRDGFGLAAHRGDGQSREWDRDDIPPKAALLGLEHDGDAVGIPLQVVEAAGGVIQLSVGGRDVVVFGTDGLLAYEDPGHEFTVDGESIHADGTTWSAATGESSDGRRLDRVPAKRLFAFAWQDDHGPDSLLTSPPSG